MKTEHSNQLHTLLRTLVYTAQGKEAPESVIDATLFDDDIEMCIDRIDVLLHKIFRDQRYRIESVLSQYADYAQLDLQVWD